MDSARFKYFYFFVYSHITDLFYLFFYKSSEIHPERLQRTNNPGLQPITRCCLADFTSAISENYVQGNEISRDRVNKILLQTYS